MTTKQVFFAIVLPPFRLRDAGTVAQREDPGAIVCDRRRVAGLTAWRLFQEHPLHVLGAVRDAPERVVSEVAALLDEEVLHSGELGVGPDARKVDRAVS